MASSITGHTYPQAPPTRLPRLSYRTKSCDTESVSSTSTGFTRYTASTTPTSPLHSDFCPSPRSPPSEMSFPSSPRQSTFTPPSKTSTLPKKRPNFLSSLFGVKEPSAQALQDYQRQLMKQGGGRVTAVGMPGVSSAKLPAKVPKVNSKWDGVPQTLKEKEKEKHHDAARQSMPGLSRQLGTSRSDGSDHRATSTADSSKKRLSRGTLGGMSTQSGSSNYLAELYGWETNSSHSGSSTINFSAEHRPSTARSAPPLQQDSSFPPHLSRPPAIHFPSTELSLPSSIGSPDPPSLSHSPMLTPYDSSPATPDASPLFLSPISPKSEANPQENTKATTLKVLGSAEEVIVKSAGVNILGPPAAAKRKPKPTPLQPREQRPNTSGADFQSNCMIRKEPPVPKDTPSSYFPNSMPTPLPSKMPARRNSTRERLGLGMSLKNQIAAPWQSPEQATDINGKGERIITPTPESGKSLRRKSRMTLFKK